MKQCPKIVATVLSAAAVVLNFSVDSFYSAELTPAKVENVLTCLYN